MLKLREFSIGYYVDGKPLLDPDLNVEITKNDLDSAETGRDESGVMHRIVLREGVRTWGFTYAILSAAEYAYMESLFKGKTTFEFAFVSEKGELCTTRAYCSKRNITLRDYRTGVYKNLKFNIIEC